MQNRVAIEHPNQLISLELTLPKKYAHRLSVTTSITSDSTTGVAKFTAKIKAPRRMTTYLKKRQVNVIDTKLHPTYTEEGYHHTVIALNFEELQIVEKIEVHNNNNYEHKEQKEDESPGWQPVKTEPDTSSISPTSPPYSPISDD